MRVSSACIMEVLCVYRPRVLWVYYVCARIMCMHVCCVYMCDCDVRKRERSEGRWRCKMRDGKWLVGKSLM
jgi:hypothetical protein